MKIEVVEARLKELAFQPLTSAAAGRLLYEMVLAEGVDDVLELGFAHGTSTAYMAAALEEKGRGRITTIDREDALQREPNIHQVLAHVGLQDWVQPVLAPRSYTWELMHILERQVEAATVIPAYDFCFIDGAHTWDADGLAFLLVDKLLRGDRWIGFDDINWTLGSSPTIKDSPRVQALPAEERSTAHMRKVVDLLVQTAGYAVRFLGGYAFAYKPDPTHEMHRAQIELLMSTRQELIHELAFPSLH